jgi:hypothetical protein
MGQIEDMKSGDRRTGGIMDTISKAMSEEDADVEHAVIRGFGGDREDSLEQPSSCCPIKCRRSPCHFYSSGLAAPPYTASFFV